jgi:Tol biopolymer transport system component/anti-sigma factor RsiW
LSFTKKLMKRPFASPHQSHLDVELLSAYIDGDVTLAERERVESHLQGCAACRAERDSLQSTVALLAALPRVAVPRAFTLSEAQVGIRRPASQPSWYGGLLRGLGAVTALALVAVVAVTLMRQPGGTSVGTLARVAPAATTPQLATAAAAQQPAGQEAAPAPASSAAEQPAAEAATETVAPAASEAATAKEAPAPAAFARSANPTEETTPAQQAESPAAAEDAAASTESAPENAAEGAPLAAEAAPLAAQAAPEASPAVAAMAANAGPTAEGTAADVAGTPQAEPSLKAAASAETGSAPVATGRGGGGPGMGGAAASAMLPAEALTPEATPPPAPLAQVLPQNVRVAYTDQKSLWAVDRNSGLRELFKGDTVTTPVVSSDGNWIAFRAIKDNYAQVWVVRWNGKQPKQLLDEKTLPKTNLSSDYRERRIQDVRWIPGKASLAVNLVAVPTGSALPKVELWQVDAESGELTYVTDMGRAFRPFYSPDGARFALLEYGTETDPKGRLRLFSADGREKRTALEFQASPVKPYYDTQIAWQPDGRSLWLALPDADPTGPTAASAMNSTTIYRVPVSGQAETAGRADAFQVNWSPDAKEMAYTRYTTDAMDTSELYLANADGKQPQLYTTMKNGGFLNWSPDDAHFLYQDNYQVYAGAAGQKPQRLGNGVSVFDARWVSDDEVISRHDTGTGWLLTLRGLDGAAYGLIALPREAELDITHR